MSAKIFAINLYILSRLIEVLFEEHYLLNSSPLAHLSIMSCHIIQDYDGVICKEEEEEDRSHDDVMMMS